jgi:glycosyltransferase involved in cell wall biosynthesis
VGFWTASAAPGDRGMIALPGAVEILGHQGGPGALPQLQAFAPDVVFAHGLDDPDIESQALAVAPAVAVEHAYHGTCISGSKTMQWPAVHACDRQFGPACLALYFPRRCGGRNPLTMVRMYGVQSTRLATLRRCAAVVTLSHHMRGEMLRHGLESSRVHVVPPFTTATNATGRTPRPAEDVVQLLFLGRLEPLKGVPRLLDALPLVSAALGRVVQLTVAGDGADRLALEQHARLIERRDSRVRVVFAGWLDASQRRDALAATDAMVVPSLWPEPFGLVGLEAAAAGVPAVAFATGGIPDWLKDGETGVLAEAEGARPRALAEAIVRCVGDRPTLDRLSHDAEAFARGWTVDRHVGLLDAVLSAAAGESAARA